METMIEKEEQKIALHQIKELKRKMQIKSTARLFCCVHVGDKNYCCSMDNLERIFDAYLEEVDRLTKESDLSNEVYLKFRKEVTELLYDAAMKRKEKEWAEYFVNKYSNGKKT